MEACHSNTSTSIQTFAGRLDDAVGDSGGGESGGGREGREERERRDGRGWGKREKGQKGGRRGGGGQGEEQKEGERGRGGSEERILKILLVSLQLSTLRGSSGLFPSSSSAVIGRGSFSNGFKYENK